MREQFMQCFAEALEKDVDTMQFSDAFRAFDEWDSLTVLSVLAMLDNEFGVVIPRTDFLKLQTIEDVYQYLLQQQHENPGE